MPTWDTAKARANAAKHGIEFRDAQRIFGLPHLQYPDLRADYREPRFVAFGMVGPSFLAVAFTMRGGDFRLISARRASHDERQTLQPVLALLGQRYAPRQGKPHV